MSKVIGLDGKTIIFGGVKLKPKEIIPVNNIWLVQLHIDGNEHINPFDEPYQTNPNTKNSLYLGNGLWQAEPSDFAFTKSDMGSPFSGINANLSGNHRVSEIIKIPENLFYSCTGISFYTGCNKLTKVLPLDTHHITDMRYLFDECYNLPEIPEYDTSNVTNFYRTFGVLETIPYLPKWNLINAENLSSMFEGRASGDTQAKFNRSYLYNIKKSLSFHFMRLTKADFANDIINNLLYVENQETVDFNVLYMSAAEKAKINIDLANSKNWNVTFTNH